MRQIVFAILVFVVFTAEKSNKWWGNTVEKIDTKQTRAVEDAEFVAKSQDEDSVWYSDGEETASSASSTRTAPAAASATNTGISEPAPAISVDPVQTEESLKRFAEALKKLAEQKRLEQQEVAAQGNNSPAVIPQSAKTSSSSKQSKFNY